MPQSPQQRFEDEVQDESGRSREQYWSQLREERPEGEEPDVCRAYLNHSMWSSIGRWFRVTWIQCIMRWIFGSLGDEEPNSEKEILEFLLRHNICLGNNGQRLALGRMIAQGAQAEIYQAEWISWKGRRRARTPSTRVFKVFKHKLPLSSLRRICALERVRVGHQGEFTTMCHGATILPDGRFAFVFERYRCNLRDLIAERRARNNGGPPFVLVDAIRILLELARGMRQLHLNDILHHDLKTDNILVSTSGGSDPASDPRPLFSCIIADFESNCDVLGSGYFRAPEILHHVKNRKVGEPPRPELFTKESDVYSWAMVAYETLTGEVPFAGRPAKDYDMVLVREERPVLPDRVQGWLRELLAECWHTNPSRRPTFYEIEDKLIMTTKE